MAPGSRLRHFCLLLVCLWSGGRCTGDSDYPTDHLNLRIYQSKGTIFSDRLVVGVATIVHGEDYIFECRSSAQQASLRWVRANVDTSLALSFPNGGVRVSLTDVSAADEGLYRCEDASTGETETINITSVNPAVIPIQKNVVLLEGSTLTLGVYSTGDPPPNSSGHIWKINQTAIPGGVTSSDGQTLTVPSVGIQHHGTFECTVVVAETLLLFRTASAYFDITVYVPPQFVASPQSGTFDEFSPVVLTCSATGNPPPRITWNRLDHLSHTHFSQANGVPLAVSTLNISTVQYGQGGAYRCTAATAVEEVDSSLQTVSSSPAQITIHHVLLLRYSFGGSEFVPAGSVAKVPSDGSEVIIHCVGSGALEWYSPSGAVVSGNSSLEVYQLHDSVLISQVLTITSFQLRHNGNYTCKSQFVTNLEESILITLNNPAVFPDHPIVYAVEGSEVELRVTVRGSPLPTADDITWYFGGVAVVDGVRHTFVADRRGLVVSAVGGGDYGMYRCVVNTSAGSDLASLSLSRPSFPTVVVMPTVLRAMVGEAVSAVCAGAGSGQLGIAWKREGGIGLPEGVSTTPQGSLTIGNASLTHNGHYVCVVSNVAGSVEQSLDIIVQEEPRLSLSFNTGVLIPSSESVPLPEGADVSFLCSASGSPEPQLHWQHNGAAILPAGIHTRTVGGGALELYSPALQSSHAGRYSCVASNDVKETTQTFTIQVQSPGKVVTVYRLSPVSGGGGASYKVPLGHTGAILTCIGTGNPLPKAKWEFGSHLVGRVRSQEVAPSETPNYASAQLVLDKPFESDDEGQFSCVVANMLRNDSVTVTIESQSDGGSEPTSTPTAPPTSEVHIQLRILFGNCTNLDSSQRSAALTAVNEAVYTSIQSLCSCGFAVNQLSSQSLVCSTQVPGALLYRATITSSATAPASTAYVHFNSWALHQPVVVVLGVPAQVDASCSLLAPSSTASECPAGGTGSGGGLDGLPFPLWVLIVLCVVGGALLVLAGIVLFCLCHVCCCHSKGSYRIYGRATSRSDSFRANFPHGDNPSVTRLPSLLHSPGNGTIRDIPSLPEDDDDCNHHYDEPAFVSQRGAMNTSGKLDGHVLMIGSSSEGSNPPASPNNDTGTYSVLHPDPQDTDEVYPSPRVLPNFYKMSLFTATSSEEKLRSQANVSANNSAHSVHISSSLTQESPSTKAHISTSGGIISSRLHDNWYHESADNIVMHHASLSQPVSMMTVNSAQPYMEPSPRRKHVSVANQSHAHAQPVRRTASHQVSSSSEHHRLGNEARRPSDRVMPSVSDSPSSVQSALV